MILHCSTEQGRLSTGVQTAKTEIPMPYNLLSVHSSSKQHETSTEGIM